MTAACVDSILSYLYPAYVPFVSVRVCLLSFCQRMPGIVSPLEFCPTDYMLPAEPMLQPLFPSFPPSLLCVGGRYYDL